MNRILDFQQNPVEILSLEELKLTVDECTTGNRPFNGITHYNLWCEIASLLVKRNIPFTIDPIHATDSRNRMMPGVSIIPALEQKYGKASLQSHLLRRVIGRIRLTGYANEEHGSGIAINFHQAGIDVAYGMNVWVCGNLNIYGDTFLHTYGTDSVPLNKLLEVVEDWTFKLDDFRQTDIGVTEMMKQVRLDQLVAVPSLVGKLAMLAVRSAYIDSKTPSPLNISQVSTFTRNLLTMQKTALQQDITVWELMNLATDIIKPGRMNTQDILQQGHALGSFFTREYLPEAEIHY